MSNVLRNRILSAAAALALLPALPAHAAFITGDIAIVRLGNAGGATNDTAQQVFIDEYTPTGALVASHALPSSGAAALTLSGAGAHDGHLNLSSDGRYLLIGGYRADAGAADPRAATAATINRVIGRIDSNWSVDTSTALSDAYDKTEFTSVVSDNGQRFWTAGSGSYDDIDAGTSVPITSGGLRFVSQLGATTTLNLSQTQQTGGANAPDSYRNAKIVGGQLYLMTASKEAFSNKRGLFQTPTPLPTSGAQTLLDVITNTDSPTGADPKGSFVPKSDAVLLDLNPDVPGIDTAYTTGGKADYEKWSLVNGVWTRPTNKLIPSGEDIQSLQGIVDGSAVTLYATTATGVYRLVDTAGWNADFSSTFSTTPLIAAPDGTQFRGLEVLVPEPGAALTLTALLLLALPRRRARRGGHAG